MMTHVIPSIARKIRTSELELMDYFDQLLSTIHKREPGVMAFVDDGDFVERLHSDARIIIDRYPLPEDRPPLFCIPFGVKDIFHVEGFSTRAGSQLPPERLTGNEANSVTRLKEAGGLVLAKTVTTEFAYFAPGPTRNPHNPEHTPGGSSSGSAAAVGAGMVPLALGTQTIGSITRPAAFCGVVGYKPSYERISREGVIPLSQSLDHIGCFTQDIASVELAASILVQDWKSTKLDNRPILGIPEGPYLQRATEEGSRHFHRTVEHLKEKGFIVRTVSVMEDFENIVERHNQILAAESAQVHALWFAAFGNKYHEKTAALIRRGQSISPEELEGALEGREELRRELTAAMDEAGIDLWISPAAPGEAPRGLESTGDPVMNLPWTHSGLPTVNLPSGFSENGLPLGLQVAGGWYADEVLLSLASGIEEALAED
ncbi:MAG: amidase [Anaerolineales bacterium]|nr:amidase [Anaerolineales bacterium]